MEKIRKGSEAKERAFEFYKLGLTALEVEKLTGIPKRTLERYMMNEKWKEKRQEAKEAEKQKIIKEYLKKNKGRIIC